MKMSRVVLSVVPALAGMSGWAMVTGVQTVCRRRAAGVSLAQHGSCHATRARLGAGPARDRRRARAR